MSKKSEINFENSEIKRLMDGMQEHANGMQEYAKAVALSREFPQNPDLGDEFEITDNLFIFCGYGTYFGWSTAEQFDEDDHALIPEPEQSSFGDKWIDPSGKDWIFANSTDGGRWIRMDMLMAMLKAQAERAKNKK